MSILRRLNILYLLIPVLIYALLRIYGHFNSSSVSFYGFAENQETQINLDHPVTVYKIYVTPGQFVKKGTLMMEVNRTALDFEMNDLYSNIAETEARERLTRTGLESELRRLYAEKMEKRREIQAEIDQMDAERTFNKTLFDGLHSVTPPDSTAAGPTSPSEVKRNALQEALRNSLTAIDAEIEGLKLELQLAGVPGTTAIGKMKTEIGLQEKEAARLKIYAPTDGLAGYIHVKEGENVSAFSALVSFYEKSPNIVLAYVHESLILQIKTGDTVNVVSGLHPEEHCLGRVTGLGHRMVEIPERLRKIPEIKTYGREVVVAIPSNNNFLQKEKVTLEWLHPNDFSIFSIFRQKAAGRNDSLW